MPENQEFPFLPLQKREFYLVQFRLKLAQKPDNGLVMAWTESHFRGHAPLDREVFVSNTDHAVCFSAMRRLGIPYPI